MVKEPYFISEGDSLSKPMSTGLGMLHMLGLIPFKCVEYRYVSNVDMVAISRLVKNTEEELFPLRISSVR